jgi:hypothetical protein
MLLSRQRRDVRNARRALRLWLMQELSGPSKTWIKVKNPKAPAATLAIDGTF